MLTNTLFYLQAKAAKASVLQLERQLYAERDSLAHGTAEVHVAFCSSAVFLAIASRVHGSGL